MAETFLRKFLSEATEIFRESFEALGILSASINGPVETYELKVRAIDTENESTLIIHEGCPEIHHGHRPHLDGIDPLHIRGEAAHQGAQVTSLKRVYHWRAR